MSRPCENCGADLKVCADCEINKMISAEEKLEEIERLCIGGRIKDHLTNEQCINAIMEVISRERVQVDSN